MSIRVVRCLAAIATAVAFNISGLAAENQNVSRGFQAEKSFDLGEIDHVNSFNGNLIVSIPVGQVYTVSPQLSYQFRLTWNSNVWEPDSVDITGEPLMYLNRISNAGASWYFGLGRLIQARDVASGNHTDLPTYLGPDGRAVTFEYTRTPGGAEDAGDNQNGQGQASGQFTLHARDSSYLRLRRGVCDTGDNSWRCDWYLDFPNGNVHSFRRSDGALTRMDDRFGNIVTISYTASTWTIQDPFRSHTVQLGLHTFDQVQRYLVEQVTLATFGGSTTTYELHYAESDIPRPTPFSSAHQSAQVYTPRLSQIRTPPIGGNNAPIQWAIHFPDYQTDATGGGKLAGTLKKLVLPTGGGLSWDYQLYNFPQDSDDKPFLRSSAGVNARRTLRADGSTEGTWSYVVEQPGVLKQCAEGNNLPPPTLARTTITPLGHSIKKFFTVWPCGGGSGPDLGEYGLPYDKAQVDAPSGAYLSEEIYACTLGQAGCTTPTRKKFIKYERHDYPNQIPPQSLGESMNQRVSLEKIVYLDDGSKFKQTAYTSHDDFGRYRTVTLSGNFDAGNSHTTTTNYLTPVSSTDPNWILGLFDSVQETENGTTSRREFDFDSATGFLNCVRTLNNVTNQTTKDLMTLFTSTGGFVTQERHYGGDRSPISIGSTATCSFGNVTPEYTIDHTYQNGSRRTSKYSAVTWKFLDLTIDANTGLPSLSKDPAGFETSFAYDFLGRLTKEEPLVKSGFSRDAWTSIAYQFGSTSTAEVKRCPAGSNCSSYLTRERYVFDHLGRLIREEREIPSLDTSQRRIEYDAQGNRTRVSTTALTSTSTGSFFYTTFQNFDPFGRPGSILNPDSTTTTFTRTGDRVVETSQSIALTIGASDVSITRRETFDRQGRLFRVEERSDPANTGRMVKTDYTYDEDGRLIEVCSDSDPNTNSCGQIRLFEYDDRGFLVSEFHPEKGASEPGIPSNGGTVSYGCYDSRGKAGQKDDGSTARRLAYFFDGVERLTHVRTRAAGVTNCAETAGTVLKQWSYDSAAGAGTGKLFEAIRRNDLPAPWSTNYQIKETYEYSGRMGRPSKRTTALTVGGAARESWSFTTAYEELGLPSSASYPVCTGGGCTAVSTVPFSVANVYTRGLLTEVTGWAQSQTDGERGIDYHPNLMISEVIHSNGVVDSIANDPKRIPRPQSIAVAAFQDEIATEAWNSGAYAFDGAGNVKSIGADLFAYDRVSRLVESRLDGSVPGREQKYTFDTYGNLTSKTTDYLPSGGTSVSFGTTPASNHLTSAKYDAAGNQTSYGATGYSYDLFNTMTALCTSSENLASCPGTGDLWAYVYTADDERVLALRRAGSAGGADTHENWTLRDFGNRILRRDDGVPNGDPIVGTGISTTCPGTIAVYCQSFEAGNANGWSTIVSGPTSIATDYVWRGDQLLASTSGSGSAEHYSLDHLSTIRVITDEFGDVSAKHTYFPFGEEATSPDQNGQRMKFTGHERDLQTTTASVADDVDYLHQRFTSPLIGRFLATDPISGDPQFPQSWNRYLITRGSPMKFIDPDGRDIEWFARDNAEGSDTNFGHSALRVFGEGYDLTYDFGRYGDTWGFMNSKGEGILRVWTDFDAFLAGQAPRGNGIAALYETTTSFDQAVIAYFQAKIDAGELLLATDAYSSYRLREDYELLGMNCTTICAEALKSAFATPSGKNAHLYSDTVNVYGKTIDPREIFRHLDASRAGTPQGMTLYYFSYTAPKK